MTLSKQERVRRKAAERAKRYRQRQLAAAEFVAESQRIAAEKQAAAEAEKFHLAEQARRQEEATKRVCNVCGKPGASFDFNGVLYCSEHGVEASNRLPEKRAELEPSLPPAVRPDPLQFNPANDPYRPSWWNPRNGLSVEPIRVGIHPLTVLINPQVLGDGRNTVEPPADLPAMTSTMDGHYETPATRAQAAAERQDFIDRARPGSPELYQILHGNEEDR